MAGRGEGEETWSDGRDKKEEGGRGLNRSKPSFLKGNTDGFDRTVTDHFSVTSKTQYFVKRTGGK